MAVDYKCVFRLVFRLVFPLLYIMVQGKKDVVLRRRTGSRSGWRRRGSSSVLHIGSKVRGERGTHACDQLC